MFTPNNSKRRQVRYFNFEIWSLLLTEDCSALQLKLKYVVAERANF